MKKLKITLKTNKIFIFKNTTVILLLNIYTLFIKGDQDHEKNLYMENNMWTIKRVFT